MCSACVNKFAVHELNQLAIEHLENGDVDGAIARLESSVDLDPEQYESRYNLANVYIGQKKCFGRKLEIHKMHVPSPILITKAESLGVDAIDGTLPRQEGDRLAASYVNYYTGNGFVALPVFGDPNDKKAIDLLQSLYPDRVVEPIYAREILLGGGNIHCITQQVPAGEAK